jgi:hypothetical protein
MFGSKTRRLQRAAMAGTLAMTLIAGCGVTGALADDDDDEPFETKIIKNIMGGLGVKNGPNIDYRERSPLVVPPKLDLPPPEQEGAAINNSAWPNDPDVAKRKQASANRKNQPRRDPDDGARPLRPDELRGIPRRSADQDKPLPQDEREAGRPLAPSALGWTGGIKDFFGVEREEYSEFTKEPARSTLLEPPPGYRTPSPAQPYGVGKRKSVSKPVTVEERAVGAQN